MRSPQLLLPPSCRRAFTISELLIAIMVIIVLAAIIIPIGSRTREKLKGFSCMNNLREIGVAVELYISEHNQLLPPISGGTEGYFQQAIAPYLRVEINLLSSAPPTRKELGPLLCPSDNHPPHSALRSYAINYYTGRSADFTAANISRRSECAAPGSILYLTDGFRNSTSPIAAARLSPKATGFTAASSEMGVDFRHSGSANALWLDGHVTPIIPAETLENSAILHPKKAK